MLVFGWTFVPGVTAFDKAAEHSSQAESCRGAVLFQALIATVLPSERVLSVLTSIVAEMPITAGLGLAYLTQLLELMIDKSWLPAVLPSARSWLLGSQQSWPFSFWSSIS